MQNRGLATLLDYLRRTAPLSGPEAVADGELLARFVQTKDEAAFELLVRRHGPMVYGVAHRMIRNEHSAEDVLQATFLALARQAKSLQRNGNVAGWLYRVAVRISHRARHRSGIPARHVPEPIDPADNVIASELRSELDAAIDRLPDKLRRSVMQCYVLGHTTEEAARLLECPKGTVLSRLAAAREKLQADLTRRGIVVSAATLTSALTTEMSTASLPAALVALALKTIGPTAALTPLVVSLAQGVLAMTWMKMTLLSCILVSAGIGVPMGLAELGPQTPATKTQVQDAPGKTKPDLTFIFNQDPKNETFKIVELEQMKSAVKSVLGNPVNTEIKKVMKERAETAIMELELRMGEWVIGRGATELNLNAARRVQESALELSRNAEQELAIRKGYVEITKSLDNLNEARFKAGAIKHQDMLLTRYARLDAEIQLMKHSGKADAQTGK